jgi:hypothetical protein
MYKVRPTLRGLSDEQIALVHESVLAILQKGYKTKEYSQ